LFFRLYILGLCFVWANHKAKQNIVRELTFESIENMGDVQDANECLASGSKGNSDEIQLYFESNSMKKSHWGRDYKSMKPWQKIPITGSSYLCVNQGMISLGEVDSS